MVIQEFINEGNIVWIVHFPFYRFHDYIYDVLFSGPGQAVSFDETIISPSQQEERIEDDMIQGKPN